MYLKDLDLDEVELLHLAQNREIQRTLVNKVMNVLY
jgi:hypothetical protein